MRRKEGRQASRRKMSKARARLRGIFEGKSTRHSRIARLERKHGNLVNSHEAAEYLGVTIRRLNQLAAAGKIERPLPGRFGSRSLIARVRSQADVVFVFDQDMNVLGKKEGSKTVPASQAELKAAGLV